MQNVGANHGIYKIMYYCAPSTVVDNKLLGGSRYSEAGFAAAYYYLGSIGAIIFSVVMGVIIGTLQNRLIKDIVNERYFRAMLLLRLYLSAQTGLSMFLFMNFGDIISIFSYLILIISSSNVYYITIKQKEIIRI